MSGKNVPKFGLPASGSAKEAYGSRKGKTPARTCSTVAALAGRCVMIASWYVTIHRPAASGTRGAASSARSPQPRNMVISK